MGAFVSEFNKRIKKLEKALLRGRSWAQLQSNIESGLCTEEIFAAFVTVSDGYTRARVCRCAASSLQEAWLGAVEAAKKHLSDNEMTPRWINVEIMCASQRAELTEVIADIRDGYNECFRRGIAFDECLETALTEAEINGSRVITYKKNTIELERVNAHLSKNGVSELPALPQTLILFDCIGWFSDEDGIYPLYGQGDNCGRRVLERFECSTALEVIRTSSDYLAMQMDFSGKFGYGVYPINHHVIEGYNMLRHASAAWSLVCAYPITGDRFILQQAELALGYLVRNSFYKYKKPPEEENTAYIAELTTREVKLGGSALAVLVMTEYMDVTGSDRYRKLCAELGNGILELMDSKSGEFAHVLKFPSLTLKDKMRTVYYDGEAALALVRLYSLTKERRWLDAAQTAVDRFIRCGYEKFRDHWVAYAVNELTKHLPEERYFAFGLKNVQVNLPHIHDRKTTYHTYLELLCAAFEMYCRIPEEMRGRLLEALGLEERQFVETIFHRAQFMLNGYAYPEYAMYLKYPEKILGAFFVRHDGYRIRIDDVHHFCSAYCSMYCNFARLDELRCKYENP